MSKSDDEKKKERKEREEEKRDKQRRDDDNLGSVGITSEGNLSVGIGSGFSISSGGLGIGGNNSGFGGFEF